MSARISPSAPGVAEAAEAERIFGELRRLSADEIGVTRASYGAGETAGLRFVAGLAREAGLDVSWDAAANLVVTLPGAAPEAPAVLVGSHMDSVPRGGNFDGAAGIVAGLISLKRFKRTGRVPPRTVKLLGLRGEESAWFGTCYIGSRALFGELGAEDLAARHREDGRTLKEHMADEGARLDLVEAGRPVFRPQEIAAYYELHIEQGPVMVARNVPVGIVTGIRGNFRHLAARCLGEAGHSGAVPRWLRRDAVLATAELLHRMDEHWTELLAQGHDLVMTAGILATDTAQHAVSRIPGETGFSFEARSQDRTTLDSVHTILEDECRRLARERRVEFALGRRVDAEPARMDEGLVRRLGRIAERLGIAAETLASGAGHDAAEFANRGVPAAMIFVRNQHGSHNPNEAMEIADFLLGTELLHQALAEEPG